VHATSEEKSDDSKDFTACKVSPDDGLIQSEKCRASNGK
jgi:hypothetical protein